MKKIIKFFCQSKISEVPERSLSKALETSGFFTKKFTGLDQFKPTKQEMDKLIAEMKNYQILTKTDPACKPPGRTLSDVELRDLRKFLDEPSQQHRDLLKLIEEHETYRKKYAY